MEVQKQIKVTRTRENDGTCSIRLQSTRLLQAKLSQDNGFHV